MARGVRRRRYVRRACWSLLGASLLASCGVLPGSYADVADRRDMPGTARHEDARAGQDDGTNPGRGAPPEDVAGPAADAADAGAGAAEAGAAAAASATSLGAFLAPGPDGVRRIGAMQTWLGGTSLRVGHTYLPGDRWSGIEGPPGLLAPWAAWRNGADDRLLVLNVPMQAPNEAGVSDRRVRALLRAGARGRFDDHFRTLAQRLVHLGASDTVLVLGWEMNGTTYTHRCAPDPHAWRRYFRRVVGVMRSVPGQRFRFDFAPNRGHDAIGWTRCYPGDDVVDIIGMDAYDQPRGRSFDAQVREPFGLQAHVDFAAAHHKPLSYPEWGLFRNGDNPEYVRRMLAWFRQHRPMYQTLTDYCPHGVWQCRQNPASSEAYRAELYALPDGSAGTVPSAPPATPPSPGTPSGTARPSAPPSAPPAPPVGRPGPPPAPERCIGLGNLCIRLPRLLG